MLWPHREAQQVSGRVSHTMGRDPHGDRGKQSAAQKSRGHPRESEEAGADNSFQGKCGGLPCSKAQGLATSCMEPFNL